MKVNQAKQRLGPRIQAEAESVTEVSWRNRQTEWLTGRQAGRQADWLTDCLSDGLTDRQTDRQVDYQADQQKTDRQTNRSIQTHKQANDDRIALNRYKENMEICVCDTDIDSAV